MLASIPKEWEQVVCQCQPIVRDNETLGFPPRSFRDDSTRLFTCVQCSKPAKHTIFRCVNCTSVFLKDFGHPNWIMDWPKCWACLEAGPDRAAEVSVSHFRQKRIRPQLRHLYIHITEGFVVPSFLDA